MTETILVTLGEWSVVKGERGHIHIWVDHCCEEERDATPLYSWIDSEGPAVCYYCKTDVPDEIQAIMKLLK